MSDAKRLQAIEQRPDEPYNTNDDDAVLAAIRRKLKAAAEDRTNATRANLTGLEAFVALSRVNRVDSLNEQRYGLGLAIDRRDADMDKLYERLCAVESQRDQARASERDTIVRYLRASAQTYRDYKTDADSVLPVPPEIERIASHIADDEHAEFRVESVGKFDLVDTLALAKALDARDQALAENERLRRDVMFSIESEYGSWVVAPHPCADLVRERLLAVLDAQRAVVGERHDA